MRDQLDRFYTKDVVAELCIKTLLEITQDFDMIVDPSAGGGAFSRQIPNCHAFDLAPTDKSIVQKDWLSTSIADFPEYNNMLVIGNPPFGVRSILAKQFIQHSIKNLNTSTIGFILPKIFNKKTNQKVFPDNWRLIKIIELSREASTFELYEEEDIFIPCDFFIWTSRNDILPEIDFRKKEVKNPDELIFVSRGSNKADLTINGNNGRVKNLDTITNPKAEHYIQINSAYEKGQVTEFLKTLIYDFHSSVNGGVAWINKDDISDTFNKTKIKNRIVFTVNGDYEKTPPKT